MSKTKYKADIRIEQRNGTTYCIKDYSRKVALIRYTYGRFSLYREAKAYAKLAGVAGLPQCYGLEDRDALVLDFIPGRSLSTFKPGDVPAEVFGKLRQILERIHARGVANGDLHRSNILLTEAGDVYLVDFACACFTNNPQRPNLLAAMLMKLDLQAFKKIEARYLRIKKPRPQGFFGLLYQTGKFYKRVRKKTGLF